MPQHRREGGEPSAPATPGLTPPSYTTCWDAAGSREHGAKGLCQERAYVCGLEAANSLIRRKVVTTSTSSAREHPVLPIRDDEPQVLIGRALNALVMNKAEALGLRWPWLR